MDGRRQTFVEKMGVLFEADGMPRIAGRIFGELLLSEEPLSLDALAERLRVSKASASTNTRLLDRLGALERVTKPGDRRDYYVVAEDMPARMLEVRCERVEKLRSALADGVCAAHSPGVRSRLEALEAFHEAIVRALNELVEAGGSGGVATARRRAVGS